MDIRLVGKMTFTDVKERMRYVTGIVFQTG